MRNSAEFTGTIRIVIANFTKESSLFEEGMQPTFFSRQAHRQEKRAWHQSGFDIEYDESEFRRDINEYNQMKQKPWMQLSFSYTFDYASDEIFCCYTIPYTYTEMQAHLN